MGLSFLAAIDYPSVLARCFSAPLANTITTDCAHRGEVFIGTTVAVGVAPTTDVWPVLRCPRYTRADLVPVHTPGYPISPTNPFATDDATALIIFVDTVIAVVVQTIAKIRPIAPGPGLNTPLAIGVAHGAVGAQILTLAVVTNGRTFVDTNRYAALAKSITDQALGALVITEAAHSVENTAWYRVIDTSFTLIVASKALWAAINTTTRLIIEGAIILKTVFIHLPVTIRITIAASVGPW